MKIGDRILTSDNSGKTKYSNVVFLPHKKNNVVASFYRISTANRDIKVSSSHILPAGKCDAMDSFLPLVYASQVWIGYHLHTIAVCFADTYIVTYARCHPFLPLPVSTPRLNSPSLRLPFFHLNNRLPSESVS